MAGNGVPNLKNNKLEREAKAWLGVPYRMGGTNKSGTDCSGFVRAIYSKVYGKTLVRQSRDMAKNISKKIKKERRLKEGDLVFFKIKGNRISHVGIYLKDGLFIHASSSRGVVVSSLDEKYYSKRFCYGGRMK